MQNHFELIRQLADFSGRQWPIGGSGGIGAPSSSREQCSTGTSANECEMIFPVSCARAIVDRCILVQGMFSAFKRTPVKSACFRPISVRMRWASVSKWITKDFRLILIYIGRGLWSSGTHRRPHCTGRGGPETNGEPQLASPSPASRLLYYLPRDLPCSLRVSRVISGHDGPNCSPIWRKRRARNWSSKNSLRSSLASPSGRRTSKGTLLRLRPSTLHRIFEGETSSFCKG